MRRTKKAFTLTEILIALGIFAIGGTAIMSLFITNIRLSQQAMDYTRAAEIQRNVRSLLTQAVTRPISVNESSTVYEFHYPETSLSFVPSEYLRDETGNSGSYAKPNMDVIAGTSVENTIYFKLPNEQFDANLIDYDQLPTAGLKRKLTSLPNEACNVNGGQVSFPELPDGPQVFRFMPSVVRQSGLMDGFDKDDRMFYSFDFSIRRSNARASVEQVKNPGVKAPLEALYVVHLRVYKGFSLPEDNEGDVVQNTPIYETDFYISAAR
ncbi:type II secretion system protein [Planctomycetota bacterium]|nr:type II secretion system protein [Planctomycetota bacterium]